MCVRPIWISALCACSSVCLCAFLSVSFVCLSSSLPVSLFICTSLFNYLYISLFVCLFRPFAHAFCRPVSRDVSHSGELKSNIRAPVGKGSHVCTPTSDTLARHSQPAPRKPVQFGCDVKTNAPPEKKEFGKGEIKWGKHSNRGESNEKK